MQFIPNGPDVPESLLQAHEDGRVVFFCGAGISYKVGLKDFKWLVDRVYQMCGTTRTSTEDAAYRKALFDTTLNILEERLQGQRRGMRMRTVIANVLQSDFSRVGAADTHSALLQLGRDRNGALRLVTTNLDRAFHEAASMMNLQYKSFLAPMLPIPKDSRWDGLVYLHGLIPEDISNTSALDQLVVTSGDFGLAYLTERWAARFVSELLRNYTVCFVGYSLNDPVLRYMLDALAADRLRGEVTRSAYAMVSFIPEKREEVNENWLSKGVIPILYRHDDGHNLLHHTLKVWALSYRDGILGKERVVTEYAVSNPTDSTKQDDFVGRMLWALSDKSGLPAKRFAEYNPVPPLTWLETLSEMTFSHDDLIRFDIPTESFDDENLQFSLLSRPAPCTHAPWLEIVHASVQACRWDNVILHIAQWLTRHMNDPTLVIWLADHGGQLNSEFVSLIERKLDFYDKLSREAKTSELREISIQSPKAIPDSAMRTIWRLFLTGRIKSTQQHNMDLYRWKERVERDGLTASLRLELRRLLAPKIMIRKPYIWSGYDMNIGDPQSIEQLVDWDLVLATDYVYTVLLNESDGNLYTDPILSLDELQLLLFDALDLLREIGCANDHVDRSYLDLPSISPHWQNRRHRDWVVLIELLRIAWLAEFDTNPDRAQWIARKWFELPFPTFKRLALFAASQEQCIPPNVWACWLLDEDAWWLWSLESQRETMRLLVLQSHKLPPVLRARIESAILTGPPCKMYGDDVEPEELEETIKRSIWELLAKFTHNEKLLSRKARSVLRTTPQEQQDWISVRENERIEFPIWTSGTGDPDYEENQEVDIAPRNWRDLVVWLKQPTEEGHLRHADTWRYSCRTRFYHCAYALRVLCLEHKWPSKRWGEALQVWSDHELICRSWRFIGPLIRTMPDETISEIAYDVASWLHEVSKSVDLADTLFVNLCNRVLDVPNQVGVLNGNYVNRALNHPVGTVAQALLDFWFRFEPNDNDSLPEVLKPVLSRICESTSTELVLGRVILASRLIALFRVDQTWTETNLLPHFNWSENENEAKAVWEGFLWSPRIYPPLMIAFKNYFLDTASHYAKLGDCGPQFTHCLVFAAIEPLDGYQPTDFQSAMDTLPKNAILHAARAVVSALEGSGTNREQYWENRVQPFWQHVWPKSNDLASSELAETLIRLSIAAQDRFPIALHTLTDWLLPIEYISFVVTRLYESGLCNQFPNEALDLLSRIVNERSIVTIELRKCLDVVSTACTELAEDSRYQRLEGFLRMRGL